MKFWQVVSWCETEQLVAVAKQAEALGFEGIILAEHIFYPKQTDSHYYYAADGKSPQSANMEFPDPLISFAAIAAATRNLKMMTGIYVLALRDPIDAAKNMATLAKLSNNRFILGVGAGWLKEEFEQFGVDFHSRGKRLDEMLCIQRKLWSGDSVTFSGDFFHLDDIQIRPYPDQCIPIVAGGYSEPALNRAADCDGWYGPGNTIEQLQTLVPQLHQRLATKQRDTSSYQVIAPLLEPLDQNKLQQMQDLGVTGTVSYPFLFGIGANSTLDEKMQYMERFADAFIR